MDTTLEIIDFIKKDLKIYKFDIRLNRFTVCDTNMQKHSLIFDDLKLIKTILNKNNIIHAIDSFDFTVQVKIGDM